MSVMVRIVCRLHQDGVLEHQDGAYVRMTCWNVTPGWCVRQDDE